MPATRETKSKPGYLTTEFGLTALVVVGTFMLILFDKLTVQQVADMWPMFIGSGLYSVARGITKQ